MILWVVGVLFALTAFLVILRFFKKKDPFGGLDAAEREKRIQKAKRTSFDPDPEGYFKNRRDNPR